MKIALISARADPYIPPVDVHGGTVLMLNLIKALNALGHKVDIFTRLDKDKESESQARRYRASRQIEKGGMIYSINDLTTIFRLKYDSTGKEPDIWAEQLKESTSFLNNVYPFLEKNNYDVIHYFHLASIAGWKPLMGNLPFIHKSTFSPLFLSVGRKFETLSQERINDEKEILNTVSIVSCQSTGEIETIKKYYRLPEEKLVKVPLGVDSSIYYAKTEHKSKVPYILICPNSIKPQKRQLEMIEIIKNLKDSGHQFFTVFIGNIVEEEYYSKVLESCKRYELTSKETDVVPTRTDVINAGSEVLFLPCQEEKKLAEYIRIADVAVFPSTDEGFSLLNLDCMSCGTVPVCADIKEYVEYMQNGINALAIELSSGVAGFTKALDQLLRNPIQIAHLSSQAAQNAKNFSWSSLVLKQLEVYNKLK